MLRFKILTEIGDMNGMSTLDVGCGFGELYAYLNRNFKWFDYTGIDISKIIVKAAKEKFPGIKFIVHDMIEKDMDKKFDYVFLSGAFNPKLENNKSFIESMIRAMFRNCAKGIAFNMFSDRVDYMDEKIHYQNRDELRKFLLTLSDNIVERDDYMKFEFTVYLYKIWQIY
jgi:SAM-dependent methyltransferase